MIEHFLRVCEEHRGEPAIHWRGEDCTYGRLLEKINGWRELLDSQRVPRGTVAAIEADFSPSSIALFLALAGHASTIVPLTSTVEAKKRDFREIAEVQVVFRLDEQDRLELERTGARAGHELYRGLREAGHPGLVLFSSGSTGKSKAAVHDLSRLLAKFEVGRQKLRTITFLLYDHIGGVNTMLYTLSNGGCLITVRERGPDAVLASVAAQRAELLPTSPTFLNLVLLAEAWKRHDLSSLRVITYGTEPMPESTLRRIHEILPAVKLQQTYGLSEVGILRSKSRDSASLWVKVGGEGYQTRIVDGLLWIRAHSAMLGYLNAPSPFDAEGWFNTGDQVEVDGEYLRFLGRKSEIINVGGEKVYPVEVENVLQQMQGVEEVAVSAEANPITGQIVRARVRLANGESGEEFRRRMRAFCRDKLAAFKIPQKVVLVDRELHGGRFKKMRNEG